MHQSASKTSCRPLRRYLIPGPHVAPPSLRPSKLETNILHPTQPSPSHHFSLPALPIANVAPRATSRPSPRLLRHSFHQIKKSIFSLRSLQLLQPALSRRDHRIDLRTLHCKTRSFLQPQRPSILGKPVTSISFFNNPCDSPTHSSTTFTIITRTHNSIRLL